MLWRPSNLPHGYIRCRKGARTQGLLATLPARPPEHGGSSPRCDPRPPSMERVLSSLFAGSRVWSRSLRAYPRRRRRRSICPISAVARLGCTPSAAYPLSPRRREIFRPPLLDRAGADVNVIRSTIYSGSSVPTNIARKERRQEKGIRRMPPLRVTAIHDGVVAVAGVGVILRSRHVTGKQARQTLASRFFQCLHDQTLSLQNTFAEPITSRGREQPGPAGDLRCPDGSAARFAIRRPSPSAAGGLRPRSPASNRDAS